ncbi:MFS transporter [Acrocarpospora sp. B8E8]|uniref:MFS transporter n=1 Tax=Acrocarpospora sp. B8E8 TaxID=3153572 RepID=UPI00325E9CC5
MRPRRVQFRLAACSIAASTLGSRVIGITYPLLALSITKSPVILGLVTFALTVPSLLFYLPASVLADRTDPRLIMRFTEFGRAMAIGSLGVAIAIEQVTIAHIIVVAFIEGALCVTYSLAETTLLSTLISRENAPARFSASEICVHIAVMAGRPLGGMLFELGRLPAFILNTGVFLLSARFLSGIAKAPRSKRSAELKHTERRASKPPIGSLLAEMANGFRELFGHPFLRQAMLITAAGNLAINAIIMIFMVNSAGLSPILVGCVLAAGGIGGVIGSSLARLPSLRTLIKPAASTLNMHMWIWVLALLIATPGEPLFYALATLITGCAGGLLNVSIRTYEIRHVDRRKLARVGGVFRLMSHSAVCLAAPLGGLLASWLTARAAIEVVFMLFATSAMAMSLGEAWRRLAELERQMNETGRPGE